VEEDRREYPRTRVDVDNAQEEYSWEDRRE
jgi:hypothetical protein